MSPLAGLGWVAAPVQAWLFICLIRNRRLIHTVHFIAAAAVLNGCLALGHWSARNTAPAALHGFASVAGLANIWIIVSDPRCAR